MVCLAKKKGTKINMVFICLCFEIMGKGWYLYSSYACALKSWVRAGKQFTKESRTTTDNYSSFEGQKIRCSYFCHVFFTFLFGYFSLPLCNGYLLFLQYCAESALAVRNSDSRYIFLWPTICYSPFVLWIFHLCNFISFRWQGVKIRQ